MQPNQLIYGTAWKEERTQELTSLALKQGFRAIDTACQPKHYQEKGVGDAIAEHSSISREDLWLQTKFTPIGGHDERVPYNPESPLPQQVKDSFETSLKNLRTDYVDSYLLHGPYHFPQLGAEDFEVWNTLEGLYASGRVRMIGISNVNIAQLDLLCQKAKVKPQVVQNRCYAQYGWDREVRDFCREHDIMYQGFSMLTANRQVLTSGRVLELAAAYKATASQVVFRFAMHVGMTPLTGTTSAEHMAEDLKAGDMFELKPEEIRYLEESFS